MPSINPPWPDITFQATLTPPSEMSEAHREQYKRIIPFMGKAVKVVGHTGTVTIAYFTNNFSVRGDRLYAMAYFRSDYPSYRAPEYGFNVATIHSITPL